MGGFLGIGTSKSAKALKEQKDREKAEVERLEKAEQIRKAEKIAKGHQEKAKIQLGSTEEDEETQTRGESSKPASIVSQSLGIGGLTKGKKATGVQL